MSDMFSNFIMFIIIAIFIILPVSSIFIGHILFVCYMRGHNKYETFIEFRDSVRTFKIIFLSLIWATINYYHFFLFKYTDFNIDSFNIGYISLCFIYLCFDKIYSRYKNIENEVSNLKKDINDLSLPSR
jgi:hypothetical protein